jgi:hypothetical protein
VPRRAGRPPWCKPARPHPHPACKQGPAAGRGARTHACGPRPRATRPPPRETAAARPPTEGLPLVPCAALCAAVRGLLHRGAAAAAGAPPRAGAARHGGLQRRGEGRRLGPVRRHARHILNGHLQQVLVRRRHRHLQRRGGQRQAAGRARWQRSAAPMAGGGAPRHRPLQPCSPAVARTRPPRPADTCSASAAQHARRPCPAKRPGPPPPGTAAAAASGPWRPAARWA